MAASNSLQCPLHGLQLARKTVLHGIDQLDLAKGSQPVFSQFKCSLCGRHTCPGSACRTIQPDDFLKPVLPSAAIAVARFKIGQLLHHLNSRRGGFRKPFKVQLTRY